MNAADTVWLRLEDNGSDVAPIPQGIKGEQSIDKSNSIAKQATLYLTHFQSFFFRHSF